MLFVGDFSSDRHHFYFTPKSWRYMLYIKAIIHSSLLAQTDLINCKHTTPICATCLRACLLISIYRSCKKKYDSNPCCNGLQALALINLAAAASTWAGTMSVRIWKIIYILRMLRMFLSYKLHCVW